MCIGLKAVITLAIEDERLIQLDVNPVAIASFKTGLNDSAGIHTGHLGAESLGVIDADVVIAGLADANGAIGINRFSCRAFEAMPMGFHKATCDRNRAHHRMGIVLIRGADLPFWNWLVKDNWSVCHDGQQMLSVFLSLHSK